MTGLLFLIPPGQRYRLLRDRLLTAGIILTILLLPPFLSAALAAREDNAVLTLQKIAGNRRIKVYIVKKGDFLSEIFHSQLGDEPIPIDLIRKLNPDIKNLNRIRPGQRVILPTREMSALMEPPAPGSEETNTKPAGYAIREGDSISRILLVELELRPEEMLPTYRLLQQLNPGIANLNQLPAGQLLKLPPGMAQRPASIAKEPPRAVIQPKEETPDAASIKIAPPLDDGPLGLIRLIIKRMKGALTASGTYYIPLADNAQISIDCSLIPVVELDDGTTAFLDFGNQMTGDLINVIRGSWANYAFIRKEELGSDLSSLQAIIRHSRNYVMTKSDKPLTLIEKPEILVSPDWLIASKKSPGGTPYRQGLFFLGNGEKPLPADTRSFLEKNGLVVTEILDGRHASVSETTPPPAPAVINLREFKGIPLAEQLLSSLGEKPVRSAEVTIFDQARNGFNLTIQPDLLIRKGEKQFIIHAKRLPQQFIRILEEGGYEVILIGERDSGRSLIETLLRGLHLPVAFGHFSVRIPEEGNRSRVNAALPALRTTAADDTLYLIDFEMPPDLASLLSGRMRGRMVQY
jgi:hypothetical protein